MNDEQWDRIPAKTITLSATATPQDTGLVITRGMFVRVIANPTDMVHVSYPRGNWGKYPNVFDVDAYGVDKLVNSRRTVDVEGFGLGTVLMSIEDGKPVELGAAIGSSAATANRRSANSDPSVWGLGRLYVRMFAPLGVSATGSIRLKICVIDD